MALQGNKKKILIFYYIILAIIIISVIVAAMKGSFENKHPNTLPTADAGINQTVYVGDAVQFAGLGTDSDGSIALYQWDFNGDGTYDWSSTTTGSTTHTYNTAGTYYAVLRVTDDKGATNTDTCIINVNEQTTNNPPVADSGSDQSVSVGDLVSFVGSGTDSDGSITKYEWDFNGDGTYDWSSTTTGSTTHTYNTAGTYYAVLRVTDDKGATDTDTCIINVNEQGGASAEIIDDNSYTDSYGYLYVVGIAKNTGTVNLNYVKISGTFYDSNGSVVDSEFTYTMLDILKPDQKSPFKIMLSEPSNYDHYSLSISFSSTSDNAYSDLQIQGLTNHTDQYGYYYIDGEVHNSGSADVTYVKVVAIIYDSSGKIIDADFTYTDPSDISAGGTESFEFMINTADLPGTIDHYELQVQCS